ncbi:MAG: ferrous iron transport protein B [Chloroflexales bacterium]|nr:ferrous iron transport protein B [Chloroflexales bacterium]
MSTLPLSQPATPLRYEQLIEGEIAALAGQINAIPALATRYPPRWLAIQLLEGEEALLDELGAPERALAMTALGTSRARLAGEYGDELDLVIAEARYRLARAVVARAVAQPATRTVTIADRIDHLTTHRILGIPIFLALMYLVFNLVQNVSAPYLSWINAVIAGPITRWAEALLALAAAPAWLRSLVIDGAIAGVGGVLVFVPGLLVLYFTLAVLEESGYLARAAFVMDRAISALGMHGKSFIPMILGFGCNVPAIYATRTIESRPARVLTGLLIPFMSCSARLPVYVIFALALFPQRADTVIWAMYLVGIVVAATVGIVLAHTVFRGASHGAFVLELPPYRLPSLWGLWSHAWRHTSGFVRKAGTVILLASVTLWLLLHLPWGVAEQRDSYFGRLSAGLAPVFAPAGFGTWEATGSLLTGVMSKEIVVATMAQVYVGETAAGPAGATPSLAADLQTIVGGFGAATLEAGKQLLEVLTPGVTLFPSAGAPEDTALSAALRGAFTPLAGIAFMLFVLLYVPCISTIAAQTHELGWRWMMLSLALTLAVPWAVATLAYQLGRMAGLG